MEPIFLNNPFINTLVIEGCECLTDHSLGLATSKCIIQKLSIRNSHIQGTPIWHMHELTTLILSECNQIRAAEAVEGLRKMKYLSYLNLCKCVPRQMATSG